MFSPARITGIHFTSSPLSLYHIHMEGTHRMADSDLTKTASAAAPAVSAGTESPAPAAAPSTLANEIHHALWEEICALKRLPGEKLSEAKLAREYHCSRIPVREAVKRLAAEGALEVFPQRGSFISRIDMTEVEQTRYLREVLETRVVLDDFDKGLLTPFITYLRAMVDRQQAMLDCGDYERFRDMDTEFHNLFYLIDNRAFVMEHTGQANVHYIRARRFALEIERSEGRRDDDSTNIVSQHRRIVEAIAAGDRAALERELLRHFRNINRTLLSSEAYRNNDSGMFR